MQEEDALIGVYEKSGKMVGSKPRSIVDSKLDILKGVYILLMNKKKQLLLVRSTGNLWKDLWGVSSGGLVRAGEEPLYAAHRTIQRELGTTATIQLISQRFVEMQGVKRFMIIFFGTLNGEVEPNSRDITQAQWITPEEFHTLVQEGQVMPTAQVVYETVHHLLK